MLIAEKPAHRTECITCGMFWTREKPPVQAGLNLKGDYVPKYTPPPARQRSPIVRSADGRGIATIYYHVTCMKDGDNVAGRMYLYEPKDKDFRSAVTAIAEETGGEVVDQVINDSTQPSVTLLQMLSKKAKGGKKQK